jgi:hypothetical protein
MMMNNMNMQPMMETEPDMGEEQLKLMYPRIYTKLMPMIKHHCDEHEHMHGTMHCPGHEQIEDMCDKIYKKVENDLDEECGEEDDNDDYRQRRYGRRGAVRDIIGILLLNELIGRRRRRRRRPRPRPHYGWY